MTSKKEIKSLLFLLDDPDPFVKESVQKRLIEIGDRAVPILDELRLGYKADEEAEKTKVTELIHQLTFFHLETDFADLLEQGIKTRKQLEDAVFTLARFGNPTLNIYDYKKKLDRYAEMVSSSIRFKLDESRALKTLLKFIFEDLNFKGDIVDYHHPDNCLMDKVMDRRVGLPISLSLVAIFVARRLKLPLFGINMPIHFMLNFVGDKEDLLIDPYDNGAVVTYDQCYFFLKKNNIEPRPDHFKIASNVEILERVIRNMIQSYEHKEKLHLVEDLNKLLAMVELLEK